MKKESEIRSKRRFFKVFHSNLLLEKKESNIEKQVHELSSAIKCMKLYDLHWKERLTIHDVEKSWNRTLETNISDEE